MKHKLKFSHIDDKSNLVYYKCEKCGVIRPIDLDYPDTIHWVLSKDDCGSTCKDFCHSWECNPSTIYKNSDFITLKCQRCNRWTQIEIGELIRVSSFCKELR